MAGEVAWGRGRACPVISEAGSHLVPVFLLGGWLFLHAAARERWLAERYADVHH